jgi:hypothetical protein
MKAFQKRIRKNNTENVVPVLNRLVKDLAEQLGIEKDEKMGLTNLQEWLHQQAQQIDKAIEQRPQAAKDFLDELDKIADSFEKTWGIKECTMNFP